MVSYVLNIYIYIYKTYCTSKSGIWRVISRVASYFNEPKEMDEQRKARLEKIVATAQLMLALIKGVVNVCVVLSLKPILKSWQLCLSFDLMF